MLPHEKAQRQQLAYLQKLDYAFRQAAEDEEYAIEALLDWVAKTEQNKMAFALSHARMLDQTEDPDRQWEAALTFFFIPLAFICICKGQISVEQIAKRLQADGYAEAPAQLLSTGGKRNLLHIAIRVAMVLYRSAVKTVDPNFEGEHVQNYGWTANWKYEAGYIENAAIKCKETWDKIHKLIDPLPKGRRWPHHINDQTIRLMKEAHEHGMNARRKELKYLPNSGKYRHMTKFENDVIKWLVSMRAIDGINLTFSRKITDSAKRIFESNPAHL